VVHHPLIGYAHYDHRAFHVNGYASGAGKWGASPLTRVRWRWSVATTPIREKCAVTTATRCVAGDTNQPQSLKILEFVKQKLHNKLTPSSDAGLLHFFRKYGMI
jgi:hypothetical protein